MALSDGLKLARVLAIVGGIGMIIGVASRLSIVGGSSTAQVILSGPGRIAVVCIVVGAWGLVSGFYNYNTKEVALKLVLSTLLVTGGLMWVIPLPH